MNDTSAKSSPSVDNILYISAPPVSVFGSISFAEVVLLRGTARSREIRNCMASRAALVRAAFLLSKGVEREPKGVEGRAGMVQVQAKPEPRRVSSL